MHLFKIGDKVKILEGHELIMSYITAGKTESVAKAYLSDFKDRIGREGKVVAIREDSNFPIKVDATGGKGRWGFMKCEIKPVDQINIGEVYAIF